MAEKQLNSTAAKQHTREMVNNEKHFDYGKPHVYEATRDISI